MANQVLCCAFSSLCANLPHLAETLYLIGVQSQKFQIFGLTHGQVVLKVGVEVKQVRLVA
jgi:hypothetical protein